MRAEWSVPRLLARGIICFGKELCGGNHNSSLESGRTAVVVVEPLPCLMAREEVCQGQFSRGNFSLREIKIIE